MCNRGGKTAASLLLLDANVHWVYASTANVGNCNPTTCGRLLFVLPRVKSHRKTTINRIETSSHFWRHSWDTAEVVVDKNTQLSNYISILWGAQQEIRGTPHNQKASPKLDPKTGLGAIYVQRHGGQSDRCRVDCPESLVELDNSSLAFMSLWVSKSFLNNNMCLNFRMW